MKNYQHWGTETLEYERRKLLEDIETRKSVVFSILLSFYITMNSYEEILNFSNSIFSGCL